MASVMCRVRGCPYQAKGDGLCRMHQRMPQKPQRSAEMERADYAALENLTAAARELLWEWETRTRRGMPRQKHTSPSAVRLRAALRQAESRLVDVAGDVLAQTSG